MNRRKPARTPYQVTTLLAGVLLLLILFITAGYFFWLLPDAQTGTADTMLSDVERQREHWRTSRPAAFRYTIERRCNCDAATRAPYLVFEREGRRSAEYLIPVESATGDTLQRPVDPVWIDDLFVRIEAAHARALAVDVSYDRIYGFPASLHVGLDADAGSESFVVRDFEIIQ